MAERYALEATTTNSATSKEDEMFERIKETFDLPVDEAAARLGTVRLA
jgi:hypothetical protein